MTNDPIVVSGIEEENEIISGLQCDCGGKFEKVFQMVSNANEGDSIIHYDTIILACADCDREKEVVFDITQYIDKSESLSDMNSDEGIVEDPVSVNLEEAQFCVPYMQLMKIAGLVDQKELSVDEALDLLEESMDYIEFQMENFEDDENDLPDKPSLENANNDIWDGLDLLMCSYEKYGESLLKEENSVKTKKFVIKSRSSFISGEKNWTELAVEGNELVNQGRNKLKKMM